MKSGVNIILPMALSMATVLAASPVTIQLESAYQTSGVLRARARSSLRAKRFSPTTDIEIDDWVKSSDLQWYASIAVGTPPQNFKVLLDTGSADLVIPGSNCTTCTGHTLFDSSKSSTFSILPGTNITSPYGTGVDNIPSLGYDNITGLLVTDVVEFGGATVQQQEFLVADYYAPEYFGMPMDGIFGLAASKSASHFSNSSTPFFWQAFNGTPFSFLMNSDATNPGVSGGELTIGGTDPSKYVGDITYLNLNVSIDYYTEYWVLDVPALYVDDALSPNSSGLAVMDTGTAYINPPDYDTTAAIYAQISREIVQIDEAGAWGAPCEVMRKINTTLAFTLGSGAQAINLTVPAEGFNLGPYANQTDICQGVFVNPLAPVYYGAPVWTIGSPFLKGYYTVWDRANSKMGFAQVKNQSSATSLMPNGTAPKTSPVFPSGARRVSVARWVDLLAGLAAVAAFAA